MDSVFESPSFESACVCCYDAQHSIKTNHLNMMKVFESHVQNGGDVQYGLSKVELLDMIHKVLSSEVLWNILYSLMGKGDVFSSELKNGDAVAVSEDDKADSIAGIVGIISLLVTIFKMFQK